jgi:hypothetical protein
MVTHCFAQKAKPETPHLEFVKEFIRELASIEDIRDTFEQDFAEARKRGIATEIFTSAIYGSTRIQLELKAQISVLSRMSLNAPFDTLIPNISDFYRDKIKLHQVLIDVSTTMLKSPKPSNDYSDELRAEASARAGLDSDDHALFAASVQVFMTLEDMRPDSKNHVSHLIITRAERDDLVSDITAGFGTKLDQKHPNLAVSTAQLLKSALLSKNWKCSDEPWE